MKIYLLVGSMLFLLVLSGCKSNFDEKELLSSNVCNGDECELTSEQIRTLESKKIENESDVINENLYIDYTQDLYNSMLGKKAFAIFFHASWCPTCEFMENDILSNSELFSDESIILKADYDAEKELKAKYGIRTQSVVAIIDSTGAHVETLVVPSASELANVLSKL